MLSLALAFSAALAAAAPDSRAADAVPSSLTVFAQVSKKVIPSVVNISTTATVKNGFRRGTPNDLFRRFFEDYLRGGRDGGEEEEPAGPRSMSLGTGFVVDSSGLILTNNHVIAGADEIKVYFTEEENERPTDGEVVGRDPELDLALIKVKTKRELKALPLGDSEAVEVGEYVLAIGNPFGQGHSVTHGIISAKGRRTPDFALAKYLQTDAPINPGNSGGPLVNLKGEVVGINNAIDARAQGIGFAIPINQVKAVLPQLKAKGSVSRGYIGVVVNDLTPEIAQKLALPSELQAPFVAHVYPDEPAAKAGIKPYDVILEFNKKPVRSSSDLIAAVTELAAGESVTVKITRNQAQQIIALKIGQRPQGSDSGRAPPKAQRPKKIEPKVNTGLQLLDITPEIAQDLALSEKTKGVVVDGFDYDSPAERAGLERGDVIVEVDQKPVKSIEEFYRVVQSKKAYLLRVRRMDSQDRESFSVLVLDLKK